MSTITLTDSGELKIGDLVVDFKDIVNRTNALPRAFVSTTPPTDFKLGDEWLNPSDERVYSPTIAGDNLLLVATQLTPGD